MKMYGNASVIVHVALFNLPKFVPEIPSVPPYLAYHALYLRLAFNPPAGEHSRHTTYDGCKRQ